ncbi:MAG: hypothetical protein LUD71_02600 [Clostridiales bacterium]|nr:hypothetical protein [Clostridiales bacterium]
MLEELEDGVYTVEVVLAGGSGRASVASPCELIVENQTATARIEWSSPYYDYMIVEDVTYLPVNEDGNSVFEIPVTAFDEPMDVTADTTAMSVPHEIEYTLTFDSASVAGAKTSPTVFPAVISAAVAALVVAIICAVRRNIGRERK